MSICFRKLTPENFSEEMFGWILNDDLRNLIPSLRNINDYEQQKSYIRKCNQAGHLWYIISLNKDDVGFVKWRQYGHGSYLFSLLIAESKNRGIGLGRQSFEFCKKNISCVTNPIYIYAEVLISNDRSIHFFTSLDFKIVNKKSINNETMYLFKKKLENDI